MEQAGLGLPLYTLRSYSAGSVPAWWHGVKKLPGRSLVDSPEKSTGQGRSPGSATPGRVSSWWD